MDVQINNTTGYKVNRYSDFSLEMSLTKDGEAYAPSAFIITFYADSWCDCAGRYTASYIGGVCTNCEVEDTTIRVFFNSPGFNLGQLKCRVIDIVDDDSFSDGTLDTCTPITLPVEIVAGAGNTDSVVLGYGSVYFGDNHDLVFEGASAPSFGNNNDIVI